MSSQVESTSVVILGGGLTGLSAAWHLAGQDYLLLEKENTLGGLARTDNYESFRFDFGSHIWYTKQPEADAFLRDLQSPAMLNHQRSACVHIYGKCVPAPFQANLYGLPKDVVSECLIGYIEATRKPRDSQNSFADWLCGSFGDGLYKHFMLPYNTKVWTLHPEELADDWTGSRVDVPSAREIIDGALGLRVNNMGANSCFEYPSEGGIGAIAESIRIQCSNIKTGVRLRGIDLGGRLIHLVDGTVVSYQSIISTIPLRELIRLTGNVPSAVEKAASQLKATKLVLVNFALKRRPDHGCHWIYFAEPKYPFFRVSFLHNYSELMCPAGCGAIQAECAFPSDAYIDEAKVASCVQSMLSEAGYLDISDLVFTKTKVINPAYVICDHNRQANLQIILSYMQLQNVCCAGRFGAWDYINMDQCILAGKNATTLVSV